LDPEAKNPNSMFRSRNVLRRVLRAEAAKATESKNTGERAFGFSSAERLPLLAPLRACACWL
jgi:hypothetical protein